jgi:hypothetical protein
VSRTVTLVLLDAAGRTLGALPPYEVPLPWWQEVAGVVAGARDRYGVDVTVLRLLRADRSVPHGGAVTYLAQSDAAPGVPLVPVAMDPAEADPAGHPLRARWAGPGGPAASLAWAAAELARLGAAQAVTAVQQRTWNLSAIWRLDAAPAGSVLPGLRGSQAHSSPPAGLVGPGLRGSQARSSPPAGLVGPGLRGSQARSSPPAGPVAWLKQVPPFFAHEAAVLRWLGAALPGMAPPLLAAGEHGRLLLAHVPGDDWYEAGVADRHLIAGDMHRVQLRSLPEVNALVSAGVPDRRGERLIRQMQGVAARHGAGVPGLADLVATLPARLAEVAACGVPDALVHGDLHPGNVRIDGGVRVLGDWGDCSVGHPAFDVLRLAEGLPPADGAALVDAWVSRWRADLPGTDPARAVELLRPVAELRAAAVYADFVANIEPSERPFHAGDVPMYLKRAVIAARTREQPDAASP